MAVDELEFRFHVMPRTRLTPLRRVGRQHMKWDDHESEDVFVLQAGLLSEQLARIALDMNVALGYTDGVAHIRLERAIRGVDDTIREIRLLAASHQHLGEVGADRRSG